MKILLTGANGYVGMRLLPWLLNDGHHVVCCVRDRNRLEVPQHLNGSVEILENDFLDSGTPQLETGDFDVAFFLIHSMASSGDFESKEELIARNFVRFLNLAGCNQLVYLSGIVNEDQLSKHLRSRYKTEEILKSADCHYTVLRAGIIVGSGSASFEIIRDLVEKLPVMVAPRWLNTLCQPISIRNVLEYLSGVMGRKDVYDQVFDIGGEEVLTYKEMLLQFAEVRRLRRRIITVPVMTPRLSSYWLFFVTSTSYPLAVNLVDSMKVDVVVKQGDLKDRVKTTPMSYRDAVKKAFQKIEQNVVVSSWKDSLASSNSIPELGSFMQVPQHGVFRDIKERTVRGNLDAVKERLFGIGGKNGWYYGNLLWRIRGYLDKMAGGVGLRRGRTHALELNAGDALDFWRVLVADYKEGRLLLYAEMRLPGEAWLEWKLIEKDGSRVLKQTATFRPNGIMGRLYWFSVMPFHNFIFSGMLRSIVEGATKEGASSAQSA
jgi:uncharacterized protein YbjT (DUF2867 family)